jgi:hypothetical protein
LARNSRKGSRVWPRSTNRGRAQGRREAAPTWAVVRHSPATSAIIHPSLPAGPVGFRRRWHHACCSDLGTFRRCCPDPPTAVCCTCCGRICLACSLPPTSNDSAMEIPTWTIATHRAWRAVACRFQAKGGDGQDEWEALVHDLSWCRRVLGSRYVPLARANVRAAIRMSQCIGRPYRLSSCQAFCVSIGSKLQLSCVASPHCEWCVSIYYVHA